MRRQTLAALGGPFDGHPELAIQRLVIPEAQDSGRLETGLGGWAYRYGWPFWHRTEVLGLTGNQPLTLASLSST